MQGITRKELAEDLARWRADIKADMTQLFDAKMASLPCSQHDERLAGIAASTKEARDKATVADTRAQVVEEMAKSAKDKADAALSAASGNVWRLAKWGIAGIVAAAGSRVDGAAQWLNRAAEALKHIRH